MNKLQKELLTLSDFAYKRLTDRLDGLTTEEYLWEPVDNCWNIRANGDGTFRGDWGVIFDEVPPVTTIAWRIGHIIDCLAAERCATWLGLEPKPLPQADGLPGTADAARAMLDRANELWRGYVSAVDDDALWENSGPIAGFYADYTRASFVLHIIDELIHHSAEVGVLRDLYRAEQLHDSFVSACLRADRSAVEAMKKEDSAIVERSLAAHPNLMLRAAVEGRFDALPLLADLGFAVDGSKQRTALHHAAGAGRIDSIEFLIDRGADVHAKDPVYQATPLQWAEYFRRTEAADYLRPLT